MLEAIEYTKYLTLSVAILSSALRLVGCDVYSSMFHIKNALSFREEYVSYMDAYIQKEVARIDKLKYLVRQFKSERFDVERPVGSYSFIKGWEALMLAAGDAANYQELQAILEARELPVMTSRDRHGAASGFLRLQSVYNLTAEELVSGPITGTHTNCTHACSMEFSMTWQDYEFISRLAFAQKDYREAGEWALLATKHSSELRPDLFFQAGNSYLKANDYDQALPYLEAAHRLQKENETISNALGTCKELIELFHQEPEPYISQQYKLLCRGNQETDPAREKHLYCSYRTTTIPYIKIKQEILNRDPKIMILYDVISKKDREMLKNEATPKLYRSKVGDPTHSQKTESRVSKVGWFFDGELGDEIVRLSKDVELFTGLNTAYRSQFAYSEPFQVNIYGMAGQYEPHHDFYPDRSMLDNVPGYILGTGDRIATYMLYLSEVKAGGSTVFPLLGVAIPPVEGAAAFWYNIKRSGEYDDSTVHAGCPVLVGEKWVANKWIRERGQEFRRPCGLTEDALDP